METKPSDWWVRVNSAGRTLCGPEWHWRSRTHQWLDYDLWTVIAGRGRMLTPEGDYPLAPGVCFLLRGGDAYEGIQSPDSRLEVIHIHFDFLAADGSLMPRDWVTARYPLHRCLHDLAIIEQLGLRVVNLWRPWDPVAMREGEHWLRAALYELESQDRHAASGPEHVRERGLHDIARLIRNDPGQPWRVQDLAAGLHLSPDHFSRLFRETIGLTPQAYRQQARLDRACFLLRFSGDTLSAIADSLGFVDVHHFGRFFRERTALSPGRYRRGGPPADTQEDVDP